MGSVGGVRYGFTVYGLRTHNPLNNSQANWRGAANRRRNERLAIKAHCVHERVERLRDDECAVVHLVRFGPRAMDDDGVIGSLKSVRDQLAEQLGVDDGNRERIRFTYAGAKGEFAVRVQIAVTSGPPWGE
jgi:hypothetical protein